MSRTYLARVLLSRSHKLTELQIRGDIEDNSKIFILFLNENICCDPSLEPSQLMMGHKICFYGEIWLIIPKLSLLSLPIWSTELLAFVKMAEELDSSHLPYTEL